MKFNRELLEAGLTSAFERYAKNPWIRTAGTIGALSAAFVAGAIYRIGADLLPLVDRGELVGSVIITIATAVVLIKLISSTISSIHSTNGGYNLIRRKIYDISANLMNMSRKKQFSCYLIVSVSCIFFLIRATFYGELVALFAACLAAFPTMAYVEALKEQWQKVLSVVALFCLSLTFLSGALWIESSKFVRAVTIKIGDQPEVRGHLVLRSQNGLFLFLEKETSVTFVPWEKIELIKSNETPMRVPMPSM